jgi:hypothetical protein
MQSKLDNQVLTFHKQPGKQCERLRLAKLFLMQILPNAQDLPLLCGQPEVRVQRMQLF